MSKNTTAQKKGLTGKTLAMLVFLIVVFAILLYVYLNMGQEGVVEEAVVSQVPTQPIELPIAMSGEANNTTIGLEQNQSSRVFIKEDIDNFFVSLLSSKKPQEGVPSASNAPLSGALPKLIPGGGTTVQLPELRNPNQLQRVSSQSSSTMPVIAAGMPTQLAFPTAAPIYQSVNISGIACNSGVCRASSSAGPLTKGSTLGGGGYVTEKIESITMSGVKTDKRFLSY